MCIAAGTKGVYSVVCTPPPSEQRHLHHQWGIRIITSLEIVTDTHVHCRTELAELVIIEHPDRLPSHQHIIIITSCA